MFRSLRGRTFGSTFVALLLAAATSCSDSASPGRGPGSVAAPNRSSSDVVPATPVPAANECATRGAGWIFCDDFDSNRLSQYFEYDSAGGRFVRTPGAGIGGSVGMRATYAKGQTGAGSLKLAFGRTPSSYIRPADGGTANYRELYWRFFVRREAGWVGNGAGKLTRAAILAKSDWSEAMIAHGWTDGSATAYQLIDPASGTNPGGQVVTVGYNDFAHLRWLGSVRSSVQTDDQAHTGQWMCYEYHAKLNTGNKSDGMFEFYVNNQLAARKTGLNWVGNYNQYGINAVFLEQYADNGAPAANVRTLDNFVVSSQPIGCGTGSSIPSAPSVASITVGIDSSALTVPHQAQATATQRDAAGNALTGGVTWTSSNPAIATVSTSGAITAVAAGSTTITATSGSVGGSAPLTVKSAPAVPVASVGVSLASSSLKIGTTTQATAAEFDAAGNTLSGRAVAWSSSNSAVATVSSSGVVTAVSPGTTTITATSEGQTGSAVVTATPGAPAAMTITTQPSTSAASGVVFAQQPVLQLRDAKNNAVTQSGIVVKAAIASGTGTLSGTTSVSSANGVVKFTDLKITGAGTSTIAFSSTGLTGATSGSIAVAAPSASKLTITTQPSATATGGTAFAQQPAIQLQDASSNPVSQSGVVVTASIASGGGTLGGTTTATTNASGVATFTNLSITGTDGSRTLSFASGALTSATSGSISVTTPASPPPSGGVQPAILEDFSTYTSTSNMLSNPRGVWDTGNKLNTNQIVLDQSVGYGSSTQSMRYDFPNNGAVCMDYGMHPGSLNLGRPTHVWIEFVVRFKTNWTLNAGASGCAQEYKLAAMGDNISGIGRWNLPEMQVGELVSGYPGNDAGFISGMDVRAKLWDGQPHVFRVEAKIGHANDGIFKFWMDGTLLVNQTGITTDPTHNYITYFAPGMNINQGPGITGMSMWWHKFAVYTTNPGW